MKHNYLACFVKYLFWAVGGLFALAVIWMVGHAIWSCYFIHPFKPEENGEQLLGQAFQIVMAIIAFAFLFYETVMLYFWAERNC